MSHDVPRSVFLVERYWPGVTLDALRQAAERTVTAASACAGTAPVRYLGSLLIEDEETVFSLFEGTDLTVVAEANLAGRFPYDRISHVVTHASPDRARRPSVGNAEELP